MLVYVQTAVVQLRIITFKHSSTFYLLSFFVSFRIRDKFRVSISCACIHEYEDGNGLCNVIASYAACAYRKGN